jgi:hypothetical protein
MLDILDGSIIVTFKKKNWSGQIMFILSVAYCAYTEYIYMKMANLKFFVFFFKGPGFIAALWGVFVFKEIQVCTRKLLLLTKYN